MDEKQLGFDVIDFKCSSKEYQSLEIQQFLTRT